MFLYFIIIYYNLHYHSVQLSAHCWWRSRVNCSGGSVPSRSTGVRGRTYTYGGNTGKKSATPRVVVTPRREGNGVPTPCENRWNWYTRSVKWPSTWSSKYIVYYYTYTYYCYYYYCILYLHTRGRVHCRFAQYVFTPPLPHSLCTWWSRARASRKNRFLSPCTVMRRTRVVADKISLCFAVIWHRAYCANAARRSMWTSS